MGDAWVLVGAGVYLADAPRATLTSGTVAASQLMTLVREASALLDQRGEAAYSTSSGRAFISRSEAMRSVQAA